MTAANSTIRQAIAPLREAAMSMAEVQAKRTIERVAKELAQAGGDLNKAAPYPSSIGMSRIAYKVAHSKYTLFNNLTQTREDTYIRRASKLADMSTERCARFIESTKENAAGQYEAYADKLDHKIGVATEATLTSANEETGENLWHHSELRVVVSGQVQTWRTRLVHNTSVLGTPYIQFPTRQVNTQ